MAHHETTEQILQCPHRREIEPLQKSFGKVTKQICNCSPQEETTIIPGEERESDFRVTRIPYSKCLVLNKKLQSAHARAHTHMHTCTHTHAHAHTNTHTHAHAHIHRRMAQSQKENIIHSGRPGIELTRQRLEIDNFKYTQRVEGNHGQRIVEGNQENSA